MSDTNEPENCIPVGKIGWNELVTSDPAGALSFYTSLFGWGTQKFPMPGADYTMVTHGGMAFGGVMAPMHPGTPSQWINYVVVADVDATLEMSARLGGKTVMGPMDIPEVGRIALLQDPQGAVIGLHQRSS